MGEEVGLPNFEEKRPIGVHHKGEIYLTSEAKEKMKFTFISMEGNAVN